jgi:replicative DNA helicase
MIQMPNSVAAEQAIIGLCLLSNDNYKLVEGQLPPEDFYTPVYGEMYKAIGELIANRVEANPITMASQLRGKAGENEQLQSLLVQIFDVANNAQSVTSLAFVISQCAYERRLIDGAGKLTEAVKGNNRDDAEKLKKEIAELVQSFSGTPQETPLSQIQKAVKAAEAGGNMMPTNLMAWDNTFGGLYKGSRYIIAGHGGVGKSALAVNIAANMGVNGYRVRWVTFEEDEVALWWRIQSRFSKVPIYAFRNGLSEAQKVALATNQDKYINSDLIVYKNLLTPSSVIQTCGMCDLIVIDGITSWPLPQAESKVEKAGIVTEYAKTIADHTGAAVIMLSHVNSENLKGTSSISGLYGGQAATFDPEGIVELRFADKEAPEGQEYREVKMHVLKNRYGPPNITKSLSYCGKYQSYGDY